MITANERRELLQAHGQIRDRPGWPEEMIAAGETAALVGKLFEAMESRGMTQADLARAMGVHRRQVLRWIRCDGSLKAETLIVMGRHVGLQLNAHWQPMAEESYSVAEVAHSVPSDEAEVGQAEWGLAA
jgi:plasmid maintenance system antidote protein VapI